MVRAGRGQLLAAGIVCVALLTIRQLHLTSRLEANKHVLSYLNGVTETFAGPANTIKNNNNNSSNNSPDGDRISSWPAEQQSRKDQIQKACQAFWRVKELLEIKKLNESRLPNKKWTPPTAKEELSRLSRSSQAISSLYVDDVYKLIYCNVPNVSSAQWKKVMIQLRGSKYIPTDDISSITTHVKNNLTTLSHGKYSHMDLLFRLKTYSKILTIRDPLDRLLSAYHDKFAEDALLSDLYHNMYGLHWIQVVRRNNNHSGILQFDEMLEYLSRHSGPTNKFNGHWRPIFDLCHPCTIQYDFIANFTTQEQDSNEILARVVQGSPKSGLRFPEVKRSSTGDLLKELLPALDPELVRDVQKKYYTDYDMFGYRRFT